MLEPGGEAVWSELRGPDGQQRGDQHELRVEEMHGGEKLVLCGAPTFSHPKY